ncbi:hypothetical protein [Streptomyces pratensis]|uniref:hypothetical protein n=1 Tax=Streptomyces pratensis TaxID=1169025 RepID=UPI00301B5F0C
MDDGKHEARPAHDPGDSALTTLIRIPVRIVVLVLVLPVRMVWDVLTAGWHAAGRVLLPPLRRGLTALADGVGRGLEAVFGGVGWVLGWLLGVLVLKPLSSLYTWVLTPLGHGLRWAGTALLAPAARGVGVGLVLLVVLLLVRPAVGLWRHVIVPVARHGVAAPLAWLYGAVLTPAGHGAALLLGALGRGAAWTLGQAWQATEWVLERVWQGVARASAVLWQALSAVGRGLGAVVGRLVGTLLVAPASWTYRRLLLPAGREVAAAFEVAWRIAGYLSRAIGRGVARLAWYLIGAPAAWAYRAVCTPVGHFARDSLWAPARRAAAEAGRTARAALATARETVRQARRDARRVLVGSTGDARSGEPHEAPARTLGSTTTVPSAAQASETSPFGEKFVKRG